MYDPVWEAVDCLERCGFRVMALVCDGLTANRKFFRLHNPDIPATEAYKTLNPFADEERYIYFISDPPHLIKTVRNAWASKKRNLWVRWMLTMCSLQLFSKCIYNISFLLHISAKERAYVGHSFCHCMNAIGQRRVSLSS